VQRQDGVLASLCFSRHIKVVLGLLIQSLFDQSFRVDSKLFWLNHVIFGEQGYFGDFFFF